MKTAFLSVRNAVAALLLLAFAYGQNLFAQEAPPTIYFEITNLKSQGDDFMDVQEEIVKPFVQERIKQGNQRAWALFRVMYPNQENAEYDYVALNVFNNFDHLHMGRENMYGIASSVWPKADLDKIVDRFDASAEDMGSQVFVLVADAVPGPPDKDNMPQIVRVNHMKVSEANSGNYAQMEQEIFMPLHQASVKAGTMSDWLLLQRIMPYGSEWDNTYLTMDMFSKWGDIAAPGPDFATVHPGKDADATWDKMAKLRELRRGEVWELVASAMEPAQPTVYKTVKEGTGPSPKMGDEVAYHGKVMNEAGESLFNTADLGFHFYHTIGSDTYNRYFDAGLLQMKKGGIMTMTIPADQQDKGLRGTLNGKTAVLKVELVDFSDPAPDGAAMLDRKIKEHGLDVAMAKYEKLASSNPKGYAFHEDKMNRLGYQLLEDGMVDESIWVFELNTKLYPKSWNTCDSLADAYAAKGDKAMARKCYEMALQINPDFAASREKLAAL